MKACTIALLLIVGCAEDNNQRCDGKLADGLRIELTLLDGVVGSEEITLRGELTRPNAVTVYTLAIAGQLATDEGDDFRLFSVKLPANTDVDAMGTVGVVAETNCPQDGTLARLQVRTSTPPRASSLKLTVPMGYRPLTPAVPIERMVTSDAVAMGSDEGLAVELASTLGSPIPASVTIRSGSATSYLYPPEHEGVAIVTARAGKLTDTAKAVFLGPPRILPATGPIYRATPHQVIVTWPSANGITAVGTCSTSAAPDIAVATSGNAITFTPSSAAVAGHGAQVVCRDVYEQTATADYAIVE